MNDLDFDNVQPLQVAEELWLLSITTRHAKRLTWVLWKATAWKFSMTKNRTGGESFLGTRQEGLIPWNFVAEERSVNVEE